MFTNAFFVILIGGEGDFRSKLLKAVNSVVVTPEEQAVMTHCQTPWEEIQTIQSSSGSINKDNLTTYWDAQIKPDGLTYSITQCALIQTEANSDLQRKQIEGLNNLYDFFIAEHKVIDNHGQPAFFDPSYMQLFDESIPLVDTHQACQPELMIMVEETITKSWMLNAMSTITADIEGKSTLTAFTEQLATDRKHYYDIAKKKSDACVSQKLEKEMPYAERAPKDVRQDWLSTVETAFKQNTDIPIVKIVFTTPEFKRFDETKAELTHSGDLKINHQNYDAMDVMVYARNGDYVDGFIVTLYKDRIANTAYARFYGFDAYGNLKPAHRVLPKNIH